MDNNKTKNIRKVPEDVQRKAQIKVGIIFSIALVLFIAVAVNNRQRAKLPKEKIEANPYEFNLYGINLDNYHFINTITIDGNTTTYEGAMYKGIIKFSDGIDEFYKKDDKYYKKVDNEWIEFDMGHNIMDFMTSKRIGEILKLAMLDNKVEYKDKSKVYNYKILTESLVSIFDNKYIDIDSEPNIISLIEKDVKMVTEINYDLSSYCKYKGCGEQVTSKINYSSLGFIKDEDVDIEKQEEQ